MMTLLDSWRFRRRPKRGNGGETHPATAPITQADELDCKHGDTFLRQGRADAALAAYTRVIELGCRGSSAHVGQARAYLMLKRIADAADSLEIALAIDPHDVDALITLAHIRREAGQLEEAIQLLDRARAIEPSRAQIYAEIASVQARLGKIDEAVAKYQQAIQLAPSDPVSQVNLGLLYLQQRGEAKVAEAYFRAVLERLPEQFEATANLGLALHDQGRYDEEFDVYRRALVTHPDNVELRWNRGLASLSLGNYREGWKDYALRFSRRGGRDIARFEFPHWDGKPLPQSRLLVLAEQGLGDEVMFASCLPDLRTMTKGVVLECAPRLEKLFARSFPDIAVNGRDRHAPLDWLAAFPDIAAKVPVGSLPMVFRDDAAAFTAHTGYLCADGERVASYRAALNLAQSQLAVGVSWRGGSRATRGALRSVELALFQELCSIYDIRVVSLQHDLVGDEKVRAENMGIVVLNDVAADLDDLAAHIAALDLIVTVDNLVLHLAGALGKQVWGLLGTSPEWRWLCTGRAVPWYPSAELFRATELGGWRGVLEEVVRRLHAMRQGCEPRGPRAYSER